MMKSAGIILSVTLIALVICAKAANKAPLELAHSIPLPQLHDGDFDHFAVDLSGNRLFSTAEENSKVLIFDLKTNKLIHTIDDVKAPHSMAYRADLKKLFVVDSDLGEVKIYDTDSYKPSGSVKLREGADASVYDPSTKYLYVVNGGKDAKLPNAYVSVVDTTAAKKLADIKVDSNDVEAMVLEPSGPRLFVVVRGLNSVEVFDRNKREKISAWPIAQEGKKPTGIAFDAADHRLFVGTRDPGKLVVLDSDSGKVAASLPAPAMIDDIAYDSKTHRIYYSGTEYTDVFERRAANHYERIGHIPTSFRAKTAILVPELNSYYIAVPHHEKQSAEVRIYKVVP